MLCALLTACAGPEGGLSLTEGSALIARHRAAFERFEAWAERTAESDATFYDARALNEVAFSPLRRDSTVVMAAIEREGGGALTLVHPSGAALDAETLFLRVAGADGIEVAVGAVRVGDAARVVTTLRRTRDAGGGASLSVTVAFAREE